MISAMSFELHFALGYVFQTSEMLLFIGYVYVVCTDDSKPL